MAVKKQTSTEYDWCQYMNDDGLYTVQRKTTEDVAKVFTKGEALAMIRELEGKPHD